MKFAIVLILISVFSVQINAEYKTDCFDYWPWYCNMLDADACDYDRGFNWKYCPQKCNVCSSSEAIARSVYNITKNTYDTATEICIGLDFNFDCKGPGYCHQYELIECDQVNLFSCPQVCNIRYDNQSSGNWYIYFYPDEQQLIVDYMNELRFNQTGTRMKKLKWDINLALAAGRDAFFQYDEYHFDNAINYHWYYNGTPGMNYRFPKIPDYTSYTNCGANWHLNEYYATNYTIQPQERIVSPWIGLSLYQVFELWKSDLDNYNYSSRTCSGSDCLNGTNLIWEQSEYIGCGFFDQHGIRITGCYWDNVGTLNNATDPYVQGTSDDCSHWNSSGVSYTKTNGLCVRN